MKKILYIFLLLPLFINAQSYLAKSVNGTNADATGNVTIAVGGAQTLNRTFADSISLSISGGNTVKIPYGVDSVSATSDSIIVYKFGIRKSYTNGASGGASLSGLTVATATNAINNANYKQRWSWNTIAGDTALVLNSTSTAAASNLQSILAVTQSGANATSTQTTYSGIFSNTKTGTTSTNYALKLSASGATNNYGLTSDADLLIKSIIAGTGKYNEATNTAFGVGALGSTTAGGGGNTAFGNSAGLSQTNGIGNSMYGFFSMKLHTGYTGNTSFGCYAMQNGSGNGNTAVGSYALYADSYANTGANNTAIGRNALYKRTSGDNTIAIGYNAASVVTTSANSVFIGSSTGASHTTSNNIILFSDGSGNERLYCSSTGNWGVGTITPNASAKVDVTSTTQGFLPPRGTTVNRDAISTPATLLQFGNTTLSTIDTYDGTRWTNGAKFLTNTATLDFPNTAAGAVSDLTITVTGAADGDVVMLGVPNGSIVAAGSFSAWVSAADIVSVRYANNALVTSYDPASGTFKVTVNK